MKEFRIYKPNKDKTGAATKFQLSLKKYDKYEEFILFLESAKQTGLDSDGNASFGWKDTTLKVIMKLEPTDIGELLLVLTGQKEKVGSGKGLYHENTKGNTILQFERKGDTGYAYRLSNKQGDKLLAIQHMISPAEGEILRVLLTTALNRSFGW